MEFDNKTNAPLGGNYKKLGDILCSLAHIKVHNFKKVLEMTLKFFNKIISILYCGYIFYIIKPCALLKKM
jgi:hypothetical protein